MVLSFKFELSESILKQLIKHLFHKFLLLFRFKSKNMVVQLVLKSQIGRLYFEYYTVTQRLKDHIKFCTTTELSPLSTQLAIITSIAPNRDFQG